MEKQESKKRFPTFPQPRRLRIHNLLRDTHSEGKVKLRNIASAKVRSNQAGYLPSLDGWRAIAVLSVILFHDSVHSTRYFSTEWIHRYGDRGVELFFAISGILICTRLLEEEKRFGQISLAGFYIRRLFRIQPAALIYLAAVAILAIFHQVPLSRGAFFSALLFFRNYYPFHGGITESTALTNHFWSLSVEEHFYLIFPGFLVLCRNRRASILGIVLLVLLGWEIAVRRLAIPLIGPLPEWRTDLRISSILVPALVAILLCKPNVLRFTTRLINPYSALCVSVAILFWQKHNMNSVSSFAAGLIFPVLILGTMLHPTSIVTGLLELAPLKFVGRISYSLYLWQQIFFSGQLFARHHWMTFLDAWQWKYIVLFAVSILSYTVLERPLIRVGHRLAPPATPGRGDMELEIKPVDGVQKQQIET